MRARHSCLARARGGLAYGARPMGTTMMIDAADRALDEQISAAREQLVRVAGADPERWWNAYELKTRARNGSGSGTMGLALHQLVEEGVVERREDLRVRLRT